MNQSATRTLISEWDNAELWDLWSCFQNSIIWRNNNNNNGRWHQNSECSSFPFFSCWSQDADFCVIHPCQMTVQCFKTLPHVCSVQNKISWMEGHYCCLHFALLISLSTDQLPIIYFSPMFLLQAELLLFLHKEVYCWESSCTDIEQTRISF